MCVCVRVATRQHIAELQNARPKKPFFFLKPPSSILLAGEGPCLRPRGVDLHFEVELALIMGQRVTALRAEDEQGALAAIDGASAVLCQRQRWELTGGGLVEGPDDRLRRGH